jgi:DNA-binding NarL/FixJ family response regulator
MALQGNHRDRGIAVTSTLEGIPSGNGTAMSPDRVRIAVVDDHSLFVRGLELLLPAVSGGRAELAGTTADAASAAGLMLRCAPDLALVELDLPDPGGVRAIEAIRRSTPSLRVVAMSSHHEHEVVLAALRAGAQGFLPKTTQPDDLLSALRAVIDGWLVLPPGVLPALLAARTAPDGIPELTHQELRLWRLIATGASTTDIAMRMHVSDRTVKRLTADLLHKLRVSSRTEAAGLAGHAGLLAGD